MKKTGFLFCLCIIVVLLAGCDRTPSGQTVILGGYSVTLDHQPSPLKVGFDALLELRVADEQGRSMDACKVSLRQSMPEMNMSHDQRLVPFSVDGNGVYHAKTGSFSMGGGWVLKILLDCGDDPVEHSFFFQLEWPE